MTIIEKDGQFIDTTPREFERGQAIEWGWIQVGRDRGIGYTSNIYESEVLQCLHDDAKRELPQGTRYEIRMRMPGNYGRTKGMAWYHCASFAAAESWDVAPGFKEEGGYWLVGQFVTPIAVLHVAPTTTEIG